MPPPTEYEAREIAEDDAMVALAQELWEAKVPKARKGRAGRAKKPDAIPKTQV